MLKKTAAAVFAGLFIACADPTTVGVEGIYASFSPIGLVVENTSSAEIYYVAFERTATASIDWAPCTDPETCPRIDAGSSETIPFNEIGFWEASSREAVLYWWRLEPTVEGGFRPDSIRALVVSK